MFSCQHKELQLTRYKMHHIMQQRKLIACIHQEKNCTSTNISSVNTFLQIDMQQKNLHIHECVDIATRRKRANQQEQ
jgi:hypothetical protein